MFSDLNCVLHAVAALEPVAIQKLGAMDSGFSALWLRGAAPGLCRYEGRSISAPRLRESNRCFDRDEVAYEPMQATLGPGWAERGFIHFADGQRLHRAGSTVAMGSA